MKATKSIPSHFDSIEELTLYRWHKYTQTKDNNWFLKDYDGRQKKIQHELLNQVEESIQDQYFKAIDDRSFTLKIQKWAKVGQLETKYAVVDGLLHRMWRGFGDDVQQQEIRFLIVEQLKKWGFKFPVMNNAMADRNLIVDYRNALEGIKTQIALLASELKEDGRKEEIGLYKQIAIAKMALSGYEINPRKVVLAEWIEICKLVQEKAKQN